MNFFQRKPTPKEAAKDAQRQTRREVRAAERNLDREIRALDRQEIQAIKEIKQRAKNTGINPQKDTAIKSMAKNLVHLRNQRSKLIEGKAHLSSVAMQATNMSSQVAVSSAISSVTSALGNANENMNASAVAKIMAEFTKQNEIAAVKEEMMDDALIDAFETDDVNEEADDITNQVLAGLGLELDGKMVGLDAPQTKLANSANTKEQEQEEEEDPFEALPDIRARLNAL